MHTNQRLSHKLASSPTAAPPPPTWARPSPSSPAMSPSASAAPSSPASTALLPLAPERYQPMHRRPQIWLHRRSQRLSTTPLPVLSWCRPQPRALGVGCTVGICLGVGCTITLGISIVYAPVSHSIGCALVVGCTVDICLGVGCTVTLGMFGARTSSCYAFGIGVGCAVGIHLGMMASVATLPSASASTTPSELLRPHRPLPRLRPHRP